LIRNINAVMVATVVVIKSVQSRLLDRAVLVSMGLTLTLINNLARTLTNVLKAPITVIHPFPSVVIQQVVLSVLILTNASITTVVAILMLTVQIMSMPPLIVPASLGIWVMDIPVPTLMNAQKVQITVTLMRHAQTPMAHSNATVTQVMRGQV
jgi:hypothetical protein